MKPWDLVKTVFEQVVDLGGDERDRRLAELCGEDEDLRREVEEALQVDQEAGPVSSGGERVAEQALGPGDRIGDWTVVELLGRGGQGIVYRATQEKEDVPREVAVKVLASTGLGDRVARFKAERAMISMVSSEPPIPTLIDVGTLEGRPFFVMEYVDGVPLDEYCAHLSLRERLAVFVGVCHAVGRLHRLAIVHRDLKPSNILVDSDGAVKILDLGISKLLEESAQGVVETSPMFSLLSRESAAPEQLDHRPTTTQTDVYALGLLLYRMMTGRHPFEEELDSGRRLADAVLRRDVPPPSEVAGSELHRSRLKGDLNAIALRALRKDPEGRYPDVGSLAADVENHLHGFPVEAARGDQLYRLRKFVARNRGLVGLTAALVMTVLGGLVALLVQQQELLRQRDEARNERERAESEQRIAERTSDFLVDLVSGVDPWQPAPNDTVEQLVDRAASLLERKERGDLQTRLRLLDTIGLVYRRLGRFEKAEEQLEEALALARERPTSTETIRLLNSVGKLYADQGKFDEALELFEEALAIAEQLVPGDTLEIADCYTQIGLVHQYRRESEPSVDLLRRALAIREELLGPSAVETAYSLLNLATSLRDAGEFEEAIDLYRKSQETFVRTQGPSHPTVAYSANNLAQILLRRGQLDDAEQMFRQALAIREEHLDPGHREIAYLHNNLAQLARYRGDLATARDLYQKSQSALESSFGPRHYLVGYSLINQGEIEYLEGMYSEAVDKASRGASMVREAAPRHPLLALAYLNLSSYKERLDDIEESTSYLDKADELVPPGSAGDSPSWRAGVLLQQGRLAFRSERRSDALDSWRRAEELGLQAFEEDQLAEGLVHAAVARLLCGDDDASDLLDELMTLGYSIPQIRLLGETP